MLHNSKTPARHAHLEPRMNIQIQYVLAADDYAEFMRAWYKHQRSLLPANQRGLRSPMLVLWLVMAGIIAIMCAAPWNWFQSPPPPPPVTTAPASTPAQLLF